MHVSSILEVVASCKVPMNCEEIAVNVQLQPVACEQLARVCSCRLVASL